MGTKYDKDPRFYANPLLEGSFALDTNREIALGRCKRYNTAFSRDAVGRAEPQIAQGVAKLLDKIDHYVQLEQPVNMTNALICLMIDEVTNYIFRESHGAFDAKDFKNDILVSVHYFTKFLQWQFYFPAAFRLLSWIILGLPTVFVDKWLQAFATQRDFLEVSQ